MLPHELLARTNSAQLSELMIHFKMMEDDRENAQQQRDAEHELTSFFGEAPDDG